MKRGNSLFIRYGKVVVLFLSVNLGSVMWGQEPEPNYGNFPYRETFLNGKPDDVSLAPVAEGVNIQNSAVFTDLGVSLTPNEQYKFGAIFINNRQFRSYNGLIVEFEYMVYSGDGGDGLCMFLFDASPGNPKIGANGAGIGYAYNRSYMGTVDGVNFNKYRMPGLSGRYLGGAFDSFGNYKAMRYQGESRVNGIPFSMPVVNSFNTEDNLRDQVTLRGAKGGSSATPGGGDGYLGYPVLITQATNHNTRTGFILDPATGRYTRHNYDTGPLFPIAGGSKFEDDSSDAYRKAIIELYPNSEGGFYVTVKIKHGKTTSTIINDYHYRTSFVYPENAFTESGGDRNSPTDLPHQGGRFVTLPATIPEFLKIGFAASTGRNTNLHIIKNVELTLPGAAIAENDSYEILRGEVATILPLENDLGFTGVIQKDQIGSNTYLDETTFRFIKEDGKPSDPPHKYITSEGEWTYDVTTKTVRFKEANANTSDVATIRYDIKAGKGQEIPYFHEAYRSLPATITVDIKGPSVLPQNTISNKMVTIKLK